MKHPDDPEFRISIPGHDKPVTLEKAAEILGVDTAMVRMGMYLLFGMYEAGGIIDPDDLHRRALLATVDPKKVQPS